jgi:hypothetical protein
VREHPVREESWRLLALALSDAGRQGDALAALRGAREVLAGELGLDPGEVLNADSGRHPRFLVVKRRLWCGGPRRCVRRRWLRF